MAEMPALHAYILANLAVQTPRMAGGADYGRLNAAAVAGLITLCRAARDALQEAGALLQEPRDASEVIYVALLDSGSDPLLVLGPLAHSLIDGPGPLQGAIHAAAGLISDTFSAPPPAGGPSRPLLEVRNALDYLRDVLHTTNGNLFAIYSVMVDFLRGRAADTWELWLSIHQQAYAQATEAIRRLNLAAAQTRLTHHRVGLCSDQCRSEEEPRSRMYALVSAVEETLRRAVGEVDGVLGELQAMHATLDQLEQIVLNAAGQAPP